MRTRHNAALVAVFIALATALATNMSAQQGSPLRGTWGLDADASDDVNMKIETAVASMNTVVRQIMRPRLRSTNQRAPQVVLSFDEQNVRLGEQGRPSATIPTNGSVLWHRDTGGRCQQVWGDCLRVSAAFENEQLEVTLQADDFRQVKRFSSDGSTLTMEVMVTSPRLPRAMSYKLVYSRRAEPRPLAQAVQKGTFDSRPRH